MFLPFEQSLVSQILLQAHNAALVRATGRATRNTLDAEYFSKPNLRECKLLLPRIAYVHQFSLFEPVPPTGIQLHWIATRPLRILPQSPAQRIQVSQHSLLDIRTGHLVHLISNRTLLTIIKAVVAPGIRDLYSAAKRSESISDIRRSHNKTGLSAVASAIRACRETGGKRPRFPNSALF